MRGSIPPGAGRRGVVRRTQRTAPCYAGDGTLTTEAVADTPVTSMKSKISSIASIQSGAGLISVVPSRYPSRFLPDRSLSDGSLQPTQSGVYMAAFYGALLTLFGPPTDEGGEHTYCYVIEASDVNGLRWTLLVLDGASGPSIRGAVRDSTLIAVAENLLHLIEQTMPADYTMTVYDDDTATEVTFGCRRGVCFSTPDS